LFWAIFLCVNLFFEVLDIVLGEFWFYFFYFLGFNFLIIVLLLDFNFLFIRIYFL